MSSSDSTDLTDDLPSEAVALYQAKPDIRQEYETVSASDYDNRSGDLAELIESAASNGQVVDLGSGEYEMSGVSLYDNACGVVGDGSGSCTVHCETGGGYLFNFGAEDPILEGVTFQASGDVALANVQTGNEGWFNDVVFRGQRDKYGANGERFTFLIQADEGATNLINNCRFPDGGTNHPERGSVGHAIGPNADPGHEGLNVWRNCLAQGFMDNGFYVAYSSGPNILWNCTARNNGGGNFRPGENDVIVGGYSEATDLPDDRISKGLEFDSTGSVQVTGLEIYGEGDAVGGGGELIQIRADSGDITLNRTVVHGVNLGSFLARLDDVEININNSWWLQEETGATAAQVGSRSADGDVTANNWRLEAVGTDEISGPITIDGTDYYGTTTAGDAGLDDPRPLPSFHFGDGEGGDTGFPAPTGSLSVFAEDDASGQRIDGAEVTATWLEDDPHPDDETGPHTGTTGSSTVAAGGVDFGQLPVGYYRIEVTHPDYETGTYDAELWRNQGETENEAMYLDTEGRLPIIYLTPTDTGGGDGGDYDYQVSAADGAGAIQSAVDDASSGETVRVTGSEGTTYEWTESIEVPNGVTYSASNNVSVTVPENHNISTYSPDGATVYSLITNADRSAAENVTIRGGEYDLSAMPETEEYAGVWLHNATDSLIDDVICRGTGQAVYDSSSNRSFNLALTRCTSSEIRDSEGYDAGYDDIGVRGGCQNCSVVRSGGSGASSGTIQTARWGTWGLTGYPTGTTFEDCWGGRIYDHDGIDTTWDGCESDYRLQTLGSDNALMQNSSGFQGYILLYTLSSSSTTSRVENFGFSGGGPEPYAIRAAPNGPDLGDVELDEITGQRNEFLRLGSYSGGGAVGGITITNVEFHAEGSGSTIISQESGAPDPSMLRVENCSFYGFDSGIEGSYDSVRVNNCDFYDVGGEPINVDSTDVQTSGNQEHTSGTNPPTDTGQLSVFAEDSVTGERITGADVTATWLEDNPHPDDDTGPHTGTTSNIDIADGGVNFGNVPIGYYQIEVTHPEYATGTYDSELWRDEGETTNEALYLDTGGRLPIIYLDPVKRWTEQTVDSDEFGDGVAVFEGLPISPPDYDIRATHSSHQPATYDDLTLDEAGRQPVVTLENQLDADTLSVKITTGDGDTPVADATVTLYRDDGN